MRATLSAVQAIATSSRRPWFWPAAAYTVAWTACLFVAEWASITLITERFEEGCVGLRRPLSDYCSDDDGFDLIIPMLLGYFVTVAVGWLVLEVVRRRRAMDLRPAWIVPFATVLGQVGSVFPGFLAAGAGLPSWMAWSIVLVAWLAAPMVGMQVWLRSGEPTA